MKEGGGDGTSRKLPSPFISRNGVCAHKPEPSLDRASENSTGGTARLASPSRRTGIGLLDKKSLSFSYLIYGAEGALHCIVISQIASVPIDTRGRTHRCLGLKER